MPPKKILSTLLARPPKKNTQPYPSQNLERISNTESSANPRLSAYGTCRIQVSGTDYKVDKVGEYLFAMLLRLIRLEWINLLVLPSHSHGPEWRSKRGAE